MPESQHECGVFWGSGMKTFALDTLGLGSTSRDGRAMRCSGASSTLKAQVISQGKPARSRLIFLCWNRDSGRGASA